MHALGPGANTDTKLLILWSVSKGRVFGTGRGPQNRLSFARRNEDLFAALKTGVSVGGGTAWLWSRPEAFETVDVLFVDEAAQMSLANVLAVSQAAKAVVLIGDPQQLDRQSLQTSAKQKAATKKTPDGFPVHSFTTLLSDLAYRHEK